VGAVLCGRKRGKVSFVIPLGGREKDKKERARCGESLDVPEAVLKGGEERSLVSGGWEEEAKCEVSEQKGKRTRAWSGEGDRGSGRTQITFDLGREREGSSGRGYRQEWMVMRYLRRLMLKGRGKGKGREGKADERLQRRRGRLLWCPASRETKDGLEKWSC
jgi:hypothetical protein